MADENNCSLIINCIFNQRRLVVQSTNASSLRASIFMEVIRLLEEAHIIHTSISMIYKCNMPIFSLLPLWLGKSLSYRTYLHMDLQWVPVIRHPRHKTICVPEDREPLHRQSGTIWRGQLHLCGYPHSHQKQCPWTTDTSSAAGWWYDTLALPSVHIRDCRLQAKGGVLVPN